MTFKELREQSGMNMKQFAAHFEIPYRTIQNWEAGVNKCPEYLLKLMEHKLKQVYLIYNDSLDDACEIKGYIIGTVEDAEQYCQKLNEGNRYEWEDFYWELLDCLNSQADMERGGENAAD